MKFTWCLCLGLLVHMGQMTLGMQVYNKTHPLIMVTWNYFEAAETAWHSLYNEKRSALDSVEAACNYCERTRCRGTVGYGGITAEDGEPTLDAMIMDGVSMDVGAVGGLRRIKHPISVARKIMETTEHSLLVGDLATKFAVEMGFPEESLSTNNSETKWKAWRDNNCQPNFRKNVSPNPEKFCGPYKPIRLSGEEERNYERIAKIGTENHDTIGVIAIDRKGRIAAATSTNGVRFKIPGRVGDSPIPGAGAYADAEIGAAATTGIGDIMMRFAPSFLAVEEMRRGASPDEAARIAVDRIAHHYPAFGGAVLAFHKDGRFGMACNNIQDFPYIVGNPESGGVVQYYANCTKPKSIFP